MQMTRLYSKIQAPVTSPIDINDDLSGVYNWLAVNKLSLNIRKYKYMVFHAINKNIDRSVTPAHIDKIPIEMVSNFNFLGCHGSRTLIL